MMERPIILKADEVRAILERGKSQMRTIMKGLPAQPANAGHSNDDARKHPAPYLDAYCGGPRTLDNPRGMTDLCTGGLRMIERARSSGARMGRLAIRFWCGRQR